MMQPVKQVPDEQTWPAPQVVLGPVRDVHASVAVAGWQSWQPLVGLSVPPSRTTPAMKQPPIQVPDEQTCPAPQPVPLLTGDQALVFVAGWQLWQELVGFAVPPSRTWPPMKQPVKQFPEEHTRPAPQVVLAPVMGLQVAVEVAGWQLSQALDGLSVPAARSMPLMRQRAGMTQPPLASQTFDPEHGVPAGATPIDRQTADPVPQATAPS